MLLPTLLRALEDHDPGLLLHVACMLVVLAGAGIALVGFEITDEQRVKDLGRPVRAATPWVGESHE